MVKILLADDHAILKGGLKNIILQNVAHCVIDETYDCITTREKVEHDNYDLIIVDVKKPDADPHCLITDILALKPSSKILMFSMRPEKLFAKRLLQLGAMGYVSKDCSELEIVNAINNALNNKKYVSASVLAALAENEFEDVSGNPFARLSRRESQILVLLLRAKTVTEISRNLKLQPSTIGTFKGRIFEKLNCSSIPELTTLAKLYNIQYN